MWSTLRRTYCAYITYITYISYITYITYITYISYITYITYITYISYLSLPGSSSKESEYKPSANGLRAIRSAMVEWSFNIGMCSRCYVRKQSINSTQLTPLSVYTSILECMNPTRLQYARYLYNLLYDIIIIDRYHHHYHHRSTQGIPVVRS